MKRHPYATMQYAKTLSHLGEAIYVPEWGSPVLVREIEFGLKDALGVYPIVILNKESDLRGGLARLKKQGLISVVLVVDDFYRPPLCELQKYFTLVKPFKTHYVYQRKYGELVYNKHHRYELRQALKQVHIEPLNLDYDVEKWIKLYSNLISRKNLTNFHLFSEKHHVSLREFNGITAIGAWKKKELLACHIWIEHNDCVYSHLAASSHEGYLCRAAYAVNDASLRYFPDAKLINFGGGAGREDDCNDGLVRFKRGFSNDEGLTFLCGAILDEERYKQLALKKRKESSLFFPSYRG